MARYSYLVHGAGGRRAGVVEAESEDAALGRLRSEGLAVLDLRPAAAGQPAAGEAAGASWLKAVRRWPGGGQNLEFMLRQVGSLLHAGVPILAVLKAVAATSPAGLGRCLGRVAQAVREGKSFRRALEAHLPGADPVTLGLIGAGEANGTLDAMCAYAADLMERARKLRGQMLQTFTYPAIVTLGALGVGYYMVRHVFPVVMEFVQQGGRRALVLPLPTRIVIALDGFLTVYGIYIILAPLLLAIAVALLRRNPRTGETVDGLALRIPLLGGAFCYHANTMWCRTFGSMLASGLDAMAAVDLTRGTMGNRLYAAQFVRVKSAIRDGRGLADSIGATRLRRLSPLAHTMVSAGEQSGKIDESLLQAAQFYEEQLNRRVELLGKLLEPAVFVVIGSFVGLVYFGFFMAVLAATRSAL